MTFEEWLQALNATLAQLEVLKAMAKREWDLGDDMTLRVTASEPGVHVEVLAKGPDGVLLPVHDVMNALTDVQAKRVYACRSAFEDWRSGKSLVLSATPPETAVKRALVEVVEAER